MQREALEAPHEEKGDLRRLYITSCVKRVSCSIYSVRSTVYILHSERRPRRSPGFTRDQRESLSLKVFADSLMLTECASECSPV